MRSLDVPAIDGPVLVTGAGGCIGSWVVAMLVNAGVDTAVLDLSDDRRRAALLMDDEALAKVRWLTGDVSETASVGAAVESVRPRAIIHLAGLQVPFCKADPVLGARVNVIGTLNVLEAARQHGIRRVAYASSVAAHADGLDRDWLKTLYGAYKHCNEETAEVYWRDWAVPSVGIRPNIVYGVARDQGMSSLPTFAMQAAACGETYSVPFTGEIGLLHAGDIAEAFIRAVQQDRDGAPVFDCNGSASTVEQCIGLIRDEVPGANVACEGNALPFPGTLSNEPLESFLGADFCITPLADGVRDTIARFRVLHQRGVLPFNPPA